MKLQTLMITILLAPLLFSGCGTPTQQSPAGATEPPKPPETPEPTADVDNPYQNYTYYYRAQTHVHGAPGRDAVRPSAEVERVYRDNGYSLLFLTNHDEVTSDPGVGCDDQEPGRCILHFDSMESGWATGPHVIVLGTTMRGIDAASSQARYKGLFSLLEPYADKYGCQLDLKAPFLQILVNFLGCDGAPVVMAHPQHTRIGMDLDDLKKTSGYTGIEIFSAGTKSMDFWYQLMECSHRRVWGFAADDCEDLYGGNEFNRNFIMVNSAKGPLSDYMADGKANEMRQDILDNIRKGNFYAVQRIGEHQGGGGIVGGDVVPKRMNLTATQEPGVEPYLKVLAYGNTIGAYTNITSTIVFLPNHGQEVHVAATTGATYELRGYEDYVRIEVVQDHYHIYSQPLFVTRYRQGLEGVVKEQKSGAPIGDVWITFVTGHCGDEFHTRADSVGHYKIGLPMGQYGVKLQSSDVTYEPVYNPQPFITVDKGFRDMDFKMSIKTGIQP